MTEENSGEKALANSIKETEKDKLMETVKGANQTEVERLKEELNALKLQKQIDDLKTKEKPIHNYQNIKLQKQGLTKNQELIKKLFGSPMDLIKYISIVFILLVAILWFINTGSL